MAPFVCVIVRQTLGWKDESGGRKSSDWLTQRQLIRRTGRSSEAISRALDSLVRQRLVEVHSAAGHILDTTSQRRQARGRIRYGLHPRLINGSPESEYEDPPTSPRNSLLRSQSCKSEFPTAAKANGTKENTKETLTKGNPLSGLANSSQALRVPSRDTGLLLDDFLEAYRQGHTRRGLGDPPEPSPDILLELSRLIERQPHLDFIALLPPFFASNLAPIKRRHYSLKAFTNTLHLLRAMRRH